MNYLLVILILILGGIFFYIVQYKINLDKVKNLDTGNINITENKIKFSSLSLKQKIAQMIVIRGDKENLQFNNLAIGGIFLSKQESEEAYKELIEKYQKNAKIKLFITTDMEGAWDPFSKDPHKSEKFPTFSEIKNSQEAYETGMRQGELLKKLGFNLNFAPVSEFKDGIYGGRVFLGTKEEIKDKLEAYINGLQKSVYGTCKHYPGKGMIGNTHLRRDKQEITKEDIELFKTCLDKNISSVMIGHQIVYGEIDSGGEPSSISKEVIAPLKEKDVLIVSDEVNMMGLRSFYLLKKEMYVDLINSGENVILDFSLNPASAHALISGIEQKIKMGEISQEKIDESVKKILEMKGYKVV
ncbi:MAG TPA: glycoside hydrolase family 3 N-terminal domain-containing protein [Candidatus Nanoarchaeia archaeon]|nr:glycoside hydrolase family 3 N-terminal domain-containing protein [Candidatus Nanoarchaeia archaeon]